MANQKHEHEHPGGTPGFSIRESTDLDHYRAQPGQWSVEVSQLAKGRFGSRIRTVELPGLIVYHNQWGCPALIRGQSPDDWLMIGGIVAPDTASIVWCGGRADRQIFAATGDAQEVEFKVENHASNVVVLIDPAMLALNVGEEAVELLRATKHLDMGEAGSRLIDIVMDMLLRVEVCPRLLDRPAIVARAVSVLMRAVEDCFAAFHLGKFDHLPGPRGEVVHNAILHVHQCGTATSAWEMAQAVGVSQKTLELAFREVMGFTPGKYLALTRLNSAHHALGFADKMETTVTEVAMSLGFTHMGRFSSAYKEMFGELPSQTLKRS